MPVPLLKKENLFQPKEDTKERIMIIFNCPRGVRDDDIVRHYAPLGTEAIQDIQWAKLERTTSSEETAKDKEKLKHDATGVVLFRSVKLLEQALSMKPPCLRKCVVKVKRFAPNTTQDLSALNKAKQYMQWYRSLPKRQGPGAIGSTLPQVTWPDPLPPVKRDFSAILRPNQASEEGAAAFRETHKISAKGIDSLPAPILDANEIYLSDPGSYMLLLGSHFEQPSVLQSQCWPLLLQGKDMVVTSEGASGAALALLLPGIVHLKGQSPVAAGDGPVVLIVAPDSTSCEKIAQQAEMFPGLRVQAVHGSPDARIKQAAGVLKAVDVVVGCLEPLLELVGAYCLVLKRVTYFVLYEASETLHEAHFEQHFKALWGQLRSDRQAVLFSATFSKGVERLMKEYLVNPVRLVVGASPEVGHNVEQEFQFYQSIKELKYRIARILQRLEMNRGTSRTVILVESKDSGWEIFEKLKADYPEAMEVFWEYSPTQLGIAKKYLKREPHARLVASASSFQKVVSSDVDIVMIAEVPDNIGKYATCVAFAGQEERNGLVYTFLHHTNALMAYPIIDYIKALGKEPPKLLVRFAKAFADPLLHKKSETAAAKKRRRKKEKKKAAKKGAAEDAIPAKRRKLEDAEDVADATCTADDAPQDAPSAEETSVSAQESSGKLQTGKVRKRHQ